MKNSSLLLATAAALLVLVLPVSAATPGFGNLYFNGSIVRTLVPPAAFPN